MLPARERRELAAERGRRRPRRRATGPARLAPARPAASPGTRARRPRGRGRRGACRSRGPGRRAPRPPRACRGRTSATPRIRCAASHPCSAVSGWPSSSRGRAADPAVPQRRVHRLGVVVGQAQGDGGRADRAPLGDEGGVRALERVEALLRVRAPPGRLAEPLEILGGQAALVPRPARRGPRTPAPRPASSGPCARVRGWRFRSRGEGCHVADPGDRLPPAEPSDAAEELLGRPALVHRLPSDQVGPRAEQHEHAPVPARARAEPAGHAPSVRAARHERGRGRRESRHTTIADPRRLGAARGVGTRSARHRGAGQPRPGAGQRRADLDGPERAADLGDVERIARSPRVAGAPPTRPRACRRTSSPGPSPSAFHRPAGCPAVSHRNGKRRSVCR